MTISHSGEAVILQWPCMVYLIWTIPNVGCLWALIVIFRHHTYKKTDHKNVELAEVGPRFEMKRKFIPSHSSHFLSYRFDCCYQFIINIYTLSVKHKLCSNNEHSLVSIHDQAWHPGQWEYSRCRVASPLIYTHRQEEEVFKRGVMKTSFLWTRNMF